MSTEERSRMLVDRILKDIVKDIKDRGDEEPMDTIKNVEGLLELAKTIVVQCTPIKVVVGKLKRKYTRKVKSDQSVLVVPPEKTD